MGTPLHAGASDSVAILIGAGDIAECDSRGDELTAALVDSLLEDATVPAWVFTIGDNVYPRGTARDFRECYNPTWGRFRHLTRPVPGNHDYKNGQFLGLIPIGGNADPYFAYFSSFPGQAGEPGNGWYDYRHSAWDVFAIGTKKNRYIRRGGEVWNWLRERLQGPERAGCAIAYYHYPRFSAGKHGDNERMRDAWQLLDRRGVDLLVVAHDHNYQRFDPQDVDGEPDPTGMRQFIVGTGGGELRSESYETAGALARSTGEHWGVLKLTLHPNSYSWEFITNDGEVWDTGTSPCQNTKQ